MSEDEKELLLFDRINVIKDTINSIGEDNVYLSFSGGKDSTILSYLIDLAIPTNTIPRVFINTGIEYMAIVKFVKELQELDKRFVIIAPSINVKTMLEKDGYPFKSKQHCHNVGVYQTSGMTLTNIKYLGNGTKTQFLCPEILKYQFVDKFEIKLSDKCCFRLKKEPVNKWASGNKKNVVITGMRSSEGGQRKNLTCIIKDKENNIVKFHPLVKVSDEWEDWFVDKYNVKLCELYYPPYEFKRTGCKGCPFSLDLEKQLEIMNRHLPNEAKQCEMIWKPVYDEYRRLGYRLKKEVQTKLDL